MHFNTENISKDVKMAFYFTSFSAFEDCYSEFVKHSWVWTPLVQTTAISSAAHTYQLQEQEILCFLSSGPPKDRQEQLLKKKNHKKTPPATNKNKLAGQCHYMKDVTDITKTSVKEV